ncbi:MAG: hypothetical protein LBT15_06385 [Synergistaceae bacterium]|nr:hypothetical protein [Synergistaceae bacterium]
MRGRFFPVRGLIVLLLAVLVCGASGTTRGVGYALASVDIPDAECFHVNISLRDSSPRGEKYVSIHDYEYGKDREDFPRVLFEMEKTPAFAERVLCLSRVIVNERFLKEKGMEFVTFNQGGFASRSFPVVADFFSSHTNLTDLSRLHTQIVQRK